MEEHTLPTDVGVGHFDYPTPASHPSPRLPSSPLVHSVHAFLLLLLLLRCGILSSCASDFFFSAESSGTVDGRSQQSSKGRFSLADIGRDVASRLTARPEPAPSRVVFDSLVLAATAFVVSRACCRCFFFPSLTSNAPAYFLADVVSRQFVCLFVDGVAFEREYGLWHGRFVFLVRNVGVLVVLPSRFQLRNRNRDGRETTPRPESHRDGSAARSQE